ncbi:MAG: hypothetical protein MJZ75_04420 [Paludibacteraceae bacterium]|nr:hypothetical protein [Paludibacteraceae bacterium]
MKRVYLIFLLIIVPICLFARSRRGIDDNYHFGYISFAGGYSSLSQNVSNVSTTGDFGYLVGLGYEFRRSSFWLSVGAQYLQEKSRTEIDEFSYIPPFKGIDDQKKNVDFYRYTIRQADQQEWKTVDVPIMLGYYYNGFYVGAGAKVGFSMSSVIRTNGEYDLSAQYEAYIDEFRNVNYYKGYVLPEQSFECQLRPQFSLLGEIGYDLLSSVMTNQRVCHVLKIGFYFEYGLRTVRPEGSMSLISIQGMTPEEAAKQGASIKEPVTLNPYYLSEATEGKRIVPYLVGLKLTYMLGGNRNAAGTWHKGCMCYQ